MKKVLFVILVCVCAPIYSQKIDLSTIVNSVIKNDITLDKKHQETLIALEEYRLSSAQLLPELSLKIDPLVAYNSDSSDTLSAISNAISLDYLQQLPSGSNIIIQLKNEMTITGTDEKITDISHKPQLNLNYKQPLFVNGRIIDYELIPSQIKSSYSKYESALLAEQEYRSRRIIDALKSYFACYFSNLKKDYYQEALYYNQSVLKKLKEKEKAGIITIKELWEQELIVSKAEIEFQEATVNFSQNVLILKQNTGFEFSNLQIINTPEINLSHIPTEDNISRLEELPSLKEAKKQISQIMVKAQLTDLKYSPSLNLGLNLSPNYTADREDPSKLDNSLSDFFKEDSGLNYSASIGLVIPLYQGGKETHDHDKDKALIQHALLSYQEHLKLIQNQYQNLLHKLDIQENHYQLLSKQHELNIKRWDDSQELLALGYITPIESELTLLEKINSSIVLEESANDIFISKLELLLFIGDDIYTTLLD